jgi:3-oxoadipate enol-lactonase
MSTLKLGDASVHYREAGSGPDAVLLLHAFPLHSGMWAPQMTALAASCRVLALDYRGLGQSRPAPGATTMDLVAGDALALLRPLELYRRAPEIFRGLALCDTRATRDTEEAKAAREAFARNALARGIPWVMDEFTPKLLRPSPDPAVARTVKSLIGEGTPEGVAAAQRGMALRVDSVPTLATITCPTLVVVGDEDQLTPFPDAQRLASTVKGARLLRIPGAGHLANLEAPAAFNAALASFVASLPA